MKLIYGFRNIGNIRGSVVSIGVFDAMHLGHQIIIKEVVKKAKEDNIKSILISFYPHPQKKKLILSLEERLNIIRRYELDLCIIIRFNLRFSQMSPQDFVKEILIKKLKVEHLFIGENFRFGKERRGNINLLKRLALKYGFKLRVFKLLKKDGYLVSSTNLRRLIQKARLREIFSLLGRYLEFKGRVKKGSGRGRFLGFPTANLSYPKDKLFLPAGVYLAEVYFKNKKLNALVYIGTKPTFKGKKKMEIEVYIFNFSDNLYGEEISLRFIERIRREKRFKTPQALKDQINKDIQKAKSLLSL